MAALLSEMELTGVGFLILALSETDSNSDIGEVFFKSIICSQRKNTHPLREAPE